MTVIVSVQIMGVVVKFTCHKDCKQILKVKEDLGKLHMEDLDLPKGKKYIYKTKVVLIIRFHG